MGYLLQREPENNTDTQIDTQNHLAVARCEHLNKITFRVYSHSMEPEPRQEQGLGPEQWRNNRSRPLVLVQA